MTHEPEKVNIKFTDHIPSSWFSKQEESSVWMSFYKAFRWSEEENGGLSYKIFNLGNVMVIIFFGEINHNIPKVDTKIAIGQLMKFKANKHSDEKAKVWHIIFMTPHNVDGKKGDERETRSRIATAVGLMGVLGGRALVYRHLTEYIFNFKENQKTFMGESLYFPPLDEINLYGNKIDEITEWQGKISELPDLNRNRVALSLRWYQEALYDSGIHGFIKYWIALEALCFTEGESIVDSINAKLASAYNITMANTRKLFEIGRIFGFRTKIIHKGEINIIHFRVIDYLQGIYSDVFLNMLHLPCKFRAKKIIEDKNFNLRGLLK